MNFAITSIDFIFNNPFVFSDRYQGQKDYFSGKGFSHTGMVWDTNFVQDVRSFDQLLPMLDRGEGATTIFFQLANSSMASHISQFPVGTYKKAHRHQAGANIVIISGEGYSLVWPEGQP